MGRSSLFFVLIYFYLLLCVANLGKDYDKLFGLVHIDWELPMNIRDMVYQGFGNLRKGKVLWNLACLAIL